MANVAEVSIKQKDLKPTFHAVVFGKQSIIAKRCTISELEITHVV